METSFKLNLISHTLSERVQIGINLMEGNLAVLIKIKDHKIWISKIYLKAIAVHVWDNK